MFYKDFADDYEKIFPYNESVYSFLNEYKPSECKKILDIGCATGHYCGNFASQGNNVTGIDLDSQMIKSAQNKYTNAVFQEMNLTDIAALDSEFDLVYSTGNVLSHVSEEDLKLFLENLIHIMSRDGIWIFQVINWDYILKLKEFIFPEIHTETKLFLRKYININSKTLLFNTELVDKKDGISLFKDKVTMYPLTSEKYISIHKEKGFKLLGHYSDYGKKPFNSNVFSADIYVFAPVAS